MSEINTISAPATLYLVGATAVGKTDFAVLLAEKLGAEIVGCDAFQIYKGLPLLTAKPDIEALARVPHHLIGEIPLTQEFDVAQYRELAMERLRTIHARGKTALVVGGTGLYLRALTRGLAELPKADPQVRAELESRSLGELGEELRRLDPIAHEQIDLQNPRRVVRALEVCILTGQPFSSFQQEWEEIPPGLRGVLLERERGALNRRIDRRVEAMFASGVLEEVSSIGFLGATVAQTLGLKEIQAVLGGSLSREGAISSIQQATRRYAKRQATWFRRERWLKPLLLTEDGSLGPSVDRAVEILTEHQAS